MVPASRAASARRPFRCPRPPEPLSGARCGGARPDREVRRRRSRSSRSGSCEGRRGPYVRTTRPSSAGARRGHQRNSVAARSAIRSTSTIMITPYPEHRGSGEVGRQIIEIGVAGSTKRPIPCSCTMRGGPWKAQNMITMRPFTERGPRSRSRYPSGPYRPSCRRRIQRTRRDCPLVSS